MLFQNPASLLAYAKVMHYSPALLNLHAAENLSKNLLGICQNIVEHNV